MGGFLDNLLGGDPVAKARELLGDRVPDVGGLSEIVSHASSGQLQDAATTAVGQLSPDQLSQLGPLVAQFAEGHGQAALPGVDFGALAAGNPDVLGAALGDLLKQDGLAALTGIFAGAQAGSEAATGQGGLGGLVGQVMGALNIGGNEFGGLLQNPTALALLSKLVPALQGIRG